MDLARNQPACGIMGPAQNINANSRNRVFAADWNSGSERPLMKISTSFSRQGHAYQETDFEGIPGLMPAKDPTGKACRPGLAHAARVGAAIRLDPGPGDRSDHGATR
jgi:hypothetical protein